MASLLPTALVLAAGEAAVRHLDLDLRRLSALCRFASQGVADLRIRRFRHAERRNPLLDIGLPGIGIAPRLTAASRAPLADGMPPFANP